MKNEELVNAIKDLINAPSCTAYLRLLGNNYLTAIGTSAEQETLSALLNQAKKDIMPIDGLIAFLTSERGIRLFGEEQAIQILAHAKAIKSQGATECDCPACSACSKILKLMA